MNNWTNYFFHTDFSESAESLAGIEVATEIRLDQRMALVSILSATDTGEGKDLWVVEGNDKEWNLSTASVAYNGKNSRDFATNSKYSHVLVLKFGSDSVQPTGRLYLQYNLVVED
ncbi:hypothetical protein D3C81_462950 [compost metagenome]